MARAKPKVKYVARTLGAEGRQVETYSITLRKDQRRWWDKKAARNGMSKGAFAQGLFDHAMEEDARMERLLRDVQGDKK